jgi:hypothetical protein
MLSALPHDGRLADSDRPHVAARGLLVGLGVSLVLWSGIAWAVAQAAGM